MTETEIYSFLTATFREVFDHEVIPTAEMSAADVPGWDSFAQISIIMATEEHFGIEFNTTDLNSLRNVGSFINVIQSKTSKAND